MKTDARVRYTKRVIKDSLLQLLKEKPIQKITVKELCALAEINRATFYTHYRDAFDLLAQVENELFADITTSVLGRLDNMDNLTGEVFRVVERNRELFKVLFEHGDHQFLTRLMEITRAKTLANWRKQYPRAAPRHLDYLYTFILSGAMAVIRQWVSTEAEDIPFDLVGLAKIVSDVGLRGKK